MKGPDWDEWGCVVSFIGFILLAGIGLDLYALFLEWLNHALGGG